MSTRQPCGYWRKFDVKDESTWPTEGRLGKANRYLVRFGDDSADEFLPFPTLYPEFQKAWTFVTHWAKIIPPEVET